MASRRGSFLDSLATIDKRKATKFIIYGIILALIFGVIMMTSMSIARNAGSWQALATKQNQMDYWDGKIGYSEYTENKQKIEQTALWMVYQEVILVNLARIGVYMGFIFVFIGFVGFAVNDSIDERTRRICLIIAGIIVFAILLNILQIALFTNYNVIYN